MQPQTLPPDFYSFMIKAARCPKEGLLMNEKNVRGLPLDAKEMVQAIQKLRPTKHALSVVGNLPPHPVAVPW